MQVPIDPLGRVVVPKAIRERLRLRGGEMLDVEEHDGVVELRVAAAQVEVVDTPEGPVAKTLDETPPLTDELVRETLERGRG